MPDGTLLLRLVPVLAAFAAGLALRRLGLAGPPAAARLIALVASLGLPALVLGTVTRLPLAPSVALLPLAAAFIVLASAPVALALVRSLGLERREAGAVATGILIMNLAVTYPFADAAWGAEGVALLAFFDFGNACVVLTLVYALAAAHGDAGARAGAVVRALLRFPPAWALAAAVAMNLSGLLPPAPLLEGLRLAGIAGVLLVVVALGILFRPPRPPRPGVVLAVALRPALGLALAALWVAAWELEGLARAVVLLGAAAPAGFNTLVFAGLHGLDREAAAATVSLSFAAALVYLPLLLLVLG